MNIRKCLITLPLCIALTFVAAYGANINGEWTDPEFNSSAIITQRGNLVDITNSFMWKGKMVEWQAQGQIRGCDVSLKFQYTQNRPEGWEPGTMELRLVNSKTLSGRWVSKTGKYRQNITLRYLRPASGGGVAAEK